MEETNLTDEIKNLIKNFKKKYPKTNRDKQLVTPNEIIKELEQLELTAMFLEDGDF